MRETVVSTRCSSDELQALLAIAEKERRHIAETLRELIREGAKARGLWPPSDQVQAAYHWRTHQDQQKQSPRGWRAWRGRERRRHVLTS